MRALWVAIAFLVLNLATATRYPAVWVDEIQFADPAVRLANGEGFTSTAWFAQTSGQFFAGNVPLYSLLLSGWVRIMGPTALGVRSFNYVLAAAMCLLICGLARRRGWVTGAGEWLLAALLLAGHAVMFSVRGGRYDAVGMCVFALAAWAWTDENPRRRTLGLLFAGAALPWAGLQTLPAAVVYCALLWMMLGRPALVRGLVLGAGIVLGGAALFGLYWSQGVWGAFRASTSGIGLIGQSMLQKLMFLPAAYLADKSGLLLLIAATVLALRSRSRLLLFAIACAAVLPAVLHLAGKFPVYYGWFTYLPLAVAVVSRWEREPAAWVKRTVAACALLAVGIGLPSRMLAVGVQWVGRDPRAVEQAVEGIATGDRAVADFKVYYALRKKGVPVYLPTYLDAMPEQEQAEVTVVLAKADDADRALRRLGGEWDPIGEEWRPELAGNAWIGRLFREFREEDYGLVKYRRRRGLSK